MKVKDEKRIFVCATDSNIRSADMDIFHGLLSVKLEQYGVK